MTGSIVNHILRKICPVFKICQDSLSRAQPRLCRSPLFPVAVATSGFPETHVAFEKWVSHAYFLKRDIFHHPLLGSPKRAHYFLEMPRGGFELKSLLHTSRGTESELSKDPAFGGNGLGFGFSGSEHRGCSL